MSRKRPNTFVRFFGCDDEAVAESIIESDPTADIPVAEAETMMRKLQIKFPDVSCVHVSREFGTKPCGVREFR